MKRTEKFAWSFREDCEFDGGNEIGYASVEAAIEAALANIEECRDQPELARTVYIGRVTFFEGADFCRGANWGEHICDKSETDPPAEFCGDEGPREIFRSKEQLAEVAGKIDQAIADALEPVVSRLFAVEPPKPHGVSDRPEVKAFLAEFGDGEGEA